MMTAMGSQTIAPIHHLTLSHIPTPRTRTRRRGTLSLRYSAPNECASHGEWCRLWLESSDRSQGYRAMCCWCYFIFTALVSGEDWTLVRQYTPVYLSLKAMYVSIYVCLYMNVKLMMTTIVPGYWGVRCLILLRASFLLVWYSCPLTRCLTIPSPPRNNVRATQLCKQRKKYLAWHGYRISSVCAFGFRHHCFSPVI